MPLRGLPTCTKDSAKLLPIFPGRAGSPQRAHFFSEARVRSESRPYHLGANRIGSPSFTSRPLIAMLSRMKHELFLSVEFARCPIIEKAALSCHLLVP